MISERLQNGMVRVFDRRSGLARVYRVSAGGSVQQHSGPVSPEALRVAFAAYRIARRENETEKHVKPLALTFESERRNAHDVTRADLANGFTRYIQEQPSQVRRDAEKAIGSWLVREEKVSYASA